MKRELEARINRVINTETFEKALEASGVDRIEFQLAWPIFDSFDELPLTYREAILAAERELQTTRIVNIA